MSFYGYSDALSQGSSFNARVNNFNQGVLIHNQRLQDQYDAEVKAQPGKVSDDKTKEEEDAAFYGVKDGTGAIGSVLAVGGALRSINQKGFKGYAVDEIQNRANTVKNTAKAIIYGEPKPKPTPQTTPTETDASGVERPALADPAAAGENARAAGSLGSGEGPTTAESSFLDESKAVMEGREPPSVGGAAGAGGEVLEGTERESSGLMTAVIKKSLQAATLGKVGDAGLSAASEIGGKVIGDFSGAIDIGKSVHNLINGKNPFSGESTADKFQEAGTALDLVGMAFPPAEVLGGALNITGGIIDAVKDVINDSDKKKQDATKPTPPKLTSVKITPAFQSMGLVASSLPSAKSQIVGGGSF